MADITTLETPYGTFAVDPARDMKVLRQMQEYGHHQLFSINLLKLFADSNSVAMDVGAHIGTFSIPLARWFKKVIAFEPSPETHALLVKNIALNRLTNVASPQKGLGSVAGHASLGTIFSGNAGGQALRIGEGSITVSTLDTEYQEKEPLCLMKIDVEGMELDVFKGGVKTIESSRPVILFEINLREMKAHNNSPKAIAVFFASRNYKIFYPFERSGKVCFGKIPSLSLVLSVVTPRSFFFNGPSMPFDVLAIPRERAVPAQTKVVSRTALVLYLFQLNISNKIQRFLCLFKKP